MRSDGNRRLHPGHLHRQPDLASAYLPAATVATTDRRRNITGARECFRADAVPRRHAAPQVQSTTEPAATAGCSTASWWSSAALRSVPSPASRPLTAAAAPHPPTPVTRRRRQRVAGPRTGVLPTQGPARRPALRPRRLAIAAPRCRRPAGAAARRRHTAATIMPTLGVPARESIQSLGHSRISLALGTYARRPRARRGRRGPGRRRPGRPGGHHGGTTDDTGRLLR
jgi:hypothetical protein